MQGENSNNQSTALKYNAKCFYKCVGSKRWCKENLHPLSDVGSNSDKGREKG